MALADILADLAHAQIDIADAVAQLNAPTSPTVIVEPGANLQALHDAAVAGTVFRIKPAYVGGPLTVTKPVTLEHHDLSAITQNRVTDTDILPTISRQLTLEAPCTVRGVSIDGEAAYTSYTLVRGITGTGGLFFDRVRVRGSANGQRRGVLLSVPNVTFTKSAITNIWYTDETQAILTERDCDGLLVSDCLLQASSIPFMAGGGTIGAPWRISKNMTFLDSEFSRPPSWRGVAGKTAAKNCFELKAAIGVTAKRCLFQYNWPGGQAGMGISVGIRNQYNVDPWSTVEDVLFEDCELRHTSGGIAILGSDYTNPSDFMRRVRFLRMRINDISATTWGGPGRVLEIQGGPIDLSFEDFVVTPGAGLLNSLCNFTNPTKKCVRFVAKQWDVPEGNYAIQHDGSGTGTRSLGVLDEFAPGRTWENVTIRRTHPVNWNYPVGTTVVPA